jgi:hypothetical protein
MDPDEFVRQLRAMPDAERRRLLGEFDRKYPSAPMHKDPNLADPAEAMAHRAMEAIIRAFREEFVLDAVGPNVTVVVAVGSVDAIPILPSGDPNTVLYALKMGWGAVHRSVRLSR